MSERPKLITPGHDFIIDPPAALFGTAGQMPKISLALVRQTGGFRYPQV